MADIKGDLIKIASQILMSCPVSTCVEDWQLPKYVSDRQLFLIQQRLDKLDSWLKSMCIKVRSAADTMEGANLQRTTAEGTPLIKDDLTGLPFDIN